MSLGDLDRVMLNTILSWIESHQLLTLLLAGVSLLTFIGSLLALPVLVASMPTDYFVDTTRHPSRLRRSHPLIYLAGRILKNAVGWLLVLCGLLMLVLPGQGLLTILVGLVLCDFPGKFRLERRLAGNARVMAACNWLRKRAGRPPFQAPQP
ncbi:MAG: PGPGW domain-containing protein [Thermochromatium sp.]